MKNVTIFLALLILASCSNKFSLQKRRYTKGFYFASHHSAKAKEQPSSTASYNTSNKVQKAEAVETVVIHPPIQQLQNETKTTLVTKKLASNSSPQAKLVKNKVLANKSISFESKHQYGTKVLERNSEKRGVISIVLRVILGIVGGLLLAFGFIFLLAGLIIPEYLIYGIVGLLVGTLCLVLAIIMKVT